MSADLFAGVNIGDKVRVEYEGGGAVEGLFNRYSETGDITVGYWTTQSPNGYGTTTAVASFEDGTPATSVTVLRRALAPEPPVGAVVRCEGCGAVHVRKDDGWHATGRTRVATWPEVNGSDAGEDFYCGPVVVIYSPDGAK